MKYLGNKFALFNFVFCNFLIIIYALKTKLKSSSTPSTSNESQVLPSNYVKEFLKDLFTDNLKGEKLLLILNNDLLNNLQINSILKKSESEISSFVIDTIENFDVEIYPREFVNGENFIVVIITDSFEIDHFFDRVSFDNKWAPYKIVLVYLNVRIPLGEKLFSSSIQRSKFIFIAELTNKMNEEFFSRYSLYPFKNVNNETFSRKIFLPSRKLKEKSSLFIKRLSSFNGKVLKVATTWEDFPFLYIRGSGKETEKVGSNIDILRAIGNKLNFSFVLIPNEKQEWGIKLNGTWTGMLGDLKYRERDLSVNTFLLRRGIFYDFETLFPYHNEGFGFLSMIPAPFSDWIKLIMPFSRIIWTLTISTIVVAIFWFYFIVKIDPRKPFPYDFSSITLTVSV